MQYCVLIVQMEKIKDYFKSTGHFKIAKKKGSQFRSWILLAIIDCDIIIWSDHPPLTSAESIKSFIDKTIIVLSFTKQKRSVFSGSRSLNVRVGCFCVLYQLKYVGLDCWSDKPSITCGDVLGWGSLGLGKRFDEHFLPFSDSLFIKDQSIEKIIWDWVLVEQNKQP